MPVIYPDNAPEPVELATAAIAEPTEEADKDEGSNWIIPTAAAIGALLVVGGIVYLLMRLRRGGTRFAWRRFRFYGSTSDQRVVREMERLVVFLHRRGLRREANETMRESVTRWGGKFTSLRTDFDNVLHHFEHARYGQSGNNDQRLQAFNDAATNIRKAL